MRLVVGVTCCVVALAITVYGFLRLTSVLEHGGYGTAAVRDALVVLGGAGALLAAGGAEFAGDVVDTARARTAADAAALASVRGGRAAADAIAAANGATVVDWRQLGDDIVVTVQVGDAVVTARATDAP